MGDDPDVGLLPSFLFLKVYGATGFIRHRQPQGRAKFFFERFPSFGYRVSGRAVVPPVQTFLLIFGTGGCMSFFSLLTHDTHPSPGSFPASPFPVKRHWALYFSSSTSLEGIADPVSDVRISVDPGDFSLFFFFVDSL